MMPCPTCGASDVRGPLEEAGELFALSARITALEAENARLRAELAKRTQDCDLLTEELAAMVERGAAAVCESHCADGITWEEVCLDPDMKEYVEQERRDAKTCLTAALSALAVKGE